MKPLNSCVILSLSLFVTLSNGALAENVYNQTGQNALQKPSEGQSLSPVGSKEPLTTFSLGQAIQTAALRNPSFKALQAQLGISEAEILTAGARLNPSVLSDNGVAERTYRLGIQQTLELGGKRKRRIELAKAKREALVAELNTQLLELRIHIRRAYTQLYNAQERQKTYQNILDVTKELVKIAQKREQAGDISKLDTLQTEILRINANNDLQYASAEVINAQTELNSILYQSLTTALSPSSPPITPQLESEYPVTVSPPGTTLLHAQVKQVDLDLNRLIETALSHRPELQQNRNSIQATAIQLALAKANRVPNLVVAAGSDLVTEPTQRRINAFIIGTAEIPVFNRQQGPIKEALARKVQLEQEQAVIKNKIALEISKAYTSFMANQARVQRYETQLLPYSIAVVDKSRQAFEAGKTNILLAINAQQAYMNTRLGHLQALMDYQNAISDLERAVGTGL